MAARLSKKFAQYFSVQNDMDDQFNKNFQEYEFSYALLERELRNIAVGKSKSNLRNYNRQIKFSYAKFTLRRLLSYRIFKKITKSDQEKILIKISSHHQIEKEICQIFEKSQNEVITSTRKDGKAAFRALEAIACHSLFWRPIVKNIIKNDSSDYIPKWHLRKLESDIKNNLDKLIKTIQYLKISHVITDGDGTPFMRLLAIACKKLDIPMIVISHCYVQEPHLNAIAPMVASHFVAWTPEQKLNLDPILDPCQKANVHYFGFPKKQYELLKPTDGTILIMWKSFQASTRPNDEALEIKKLTKKIEKLGWKSVVRLHPRDTTDPVVLSILKQQDIKFSTNSMKADLDSCCCVVGHGTGALVEAAFHGKRVANLCLDGVYMEFEGCEAITYDTLDSFLISSRNCSNQTPLKEFDSNAFCSWVLSSIKIRSGF